LGLVQLGHFNVESDGLSAFVYGEPASFVYAQRQFSNGTKEINRSVRENDSVKENKRILHRILKPVCTRSRTLQEEKNARKDSKP
jgi:hypothetical protein